MASPPQPLEDAPTDDPQPSAWSTSPSEECLTPSEAVGSTGLLSRADINALRRTSSVASSSPSQAKGQRGEFHLRRASSFGKQASGASPLSPSQSLCPSPSGTRRASTNVAMDPLLRPGSNQPPLLGPTEQFAPPTPTATPPMLRADSVCRQPLQELDEPNEGPGAVQLHRASGSSLQRRPSHSHVMSNIADLPPRRSSDAILSESDMMQDAAAKLESHALFQGANNQQFMQKLLQNFKPRLYKPTDPPIIKYGDVGRAMYFIYKGAVEVMSEDGETMYARLGEGKFFGEVAILFSVPRTATIVAATKCICFSLRKEDLEGVLGDFPDVALTIRREAVERFAEYKKLHAKKYDDIAVEGQAGNDALGKMRTNIEEVPLFHGCEVGFLQMLTLSQKAHHFPKDTWVVRQGDTGHNMYFIASGSVEVVDDSGTVLSVLHANDFFGEVAVFKQVPRIASVRTLEGCELFVLDRAGLEGLVPKYPEMHRRMLDVADRRHQLHLAPARPQPLPALTVQAPSDLDLSQLRSMHQDTAVTPTPVCQETHTEASAEVHVAPLDSHPATVPSEPPYVPPTTDTEPVYVPPTYDSESVYVPPTYDSEPVYVPPTYDSEPVYVPPVYCNEGDGGAQGGVVNSTVDRIKRQAMRKRSPSIAVWNGPLFVEDAAKPMRFTAGEQPAAVLEQGTALLGDRKLIGRILSFLPTPHMLRLAAVCRLWKEVIETSDVAWGRVGLEVAHKKVTDKVLDPLLLRHGACMRTLCLRNCWSISDHGLRAVAMHCHSLTSLSLFSCWEITSEGVGAVASACPNLRCVNLSNCRKVTDQAIVTLANACIHLQRIELSYCKNLTDVALDYILARCRRLRHLNLQRCTGLSKEAFQAFARHRAYDMAVLVLSDLFQLDDSAVLAVAQGCPALVELSLAFCSALTAQSMGALGAHCPDLRLLDMSSCPNAVTDVAVDLLLTNPAPRTSLQTLVLKSCSALTDVGLLKLNGLCANLKTVNVANCKGITEDGAAACTCIQHVDLGSRKKPRLASSGLGLQPS